jgi:hypothetical protein
VQGMFRVGEALELVRKWQHPWRCKDYTW